MWQRRIKLSLVFLLYLMGGLLFSAVDRPRMEAIPVWDVTIEDSFFLPRITTNQAVGIRHTFSACDHSLRNFDLASGKIAGEHGGTNASDSDVFKIIEGAAYSLHHRRDEKLEHFVDRLIDRIVAAQKSDGYLNTFFTIKEPENRFKALRSKHELYNAGHLFEAALAYNQATGKRKLLDAAIKYADLIDSIFGEGKRYDVPGHQEIELALVKLYLATGTKRYLQLAKFFLDERGYVHGKQRLPFDPSASQPQKNRWLSRNGIMQDHKPVVDQLEATGHAVRAGYMFSAMLDVASLTAAPGYLNAVDHLWQDVVRHKLYITGGVGSAQFRDEGFGEPYLLPNLKAYCETCAAISFFFWNHRMGLRHGDGKYFDTMELSLYNGILSGVSLSGDRFFYRNPLEVDKEYMRRPWYEPGCCPSNMVRFLPQIGKYIYTKDETGIYINLYIGSSVEITRKNNHIRISQVTDYPWDGRISISVEPQRTSRFDVRVRIPGWVTGRPVPSNLYDSRAVPGESAVPVRVYVNRKQLRSGPVRNGYLTISRRWKRGDRIEIKLPMPIRRVTGHTSLAAGRGKMAMMRGPLVYCLEEVDNPVLFAGKKGVVLAKDINFRGEYNADLLGGVVLLRGHISGEVAEESSLITAVPYYSWANRRPGKMIVWLPVESR